MMPSSLHANAVLDAALDRRRLRRRLPAPATRRQIRESAGLTQSVFAGALGVSIAAISRWETGERDPRDPDLLARYTELLRRLAQEDLAR